MPKTVIVIPCYNEEKRLEFREVEALLARDSVEVLLVNDGSRDGTLELLRRFSESHERARVHNLEKNSGKAEAVRQGLQSAIAGGAEVVGYLDADFATPSREALAMLDEMDASQTQVVMGSRVRLLGRRIDRKAARHFLGRVFATVASWSLRLSVYDTQCGAKLFRVGEPLKLALERRFESRWAFDVELLSRLTSQRESFLTADDFVEYPLREWQDRAGSKLTARAMARAGLDLLKIGIRARYCRD